MTNNGIETMQRRGQAYWYEDGIWELVLGVLFAAYAVYYGVVGLLPEDNTVGRILTVGYIAIIPGGMLLASRIVARLKSRISAPRTGYVSFRRSPRRWVRSAAVAAAAAIVSVVGFLLVDLVYVPVLVGGAGLAVALGWVGVRLGLVRIVVVGAISAVFAVALSLVTDDPEVAFSTLFGATGVASAIAGAGALVRYLREHPRPAEGEPASEDGRKEE
ncbi:MAG: hypothetical protein ACLFUA_00830 [Spirochaetales bacterium]